MNESVWGDFSKKVEEKRSKWCGHVIRGGLRTKEGEEEEEKA